MKKYLTALMMAWGNFLSIPCPKKIWDNNLKKEMLSLLPIIGLVAGVIEFALCYFMWRLGVPIAVSAFFLTLYAFGISGFMHADGFMDCCDAILSRRDLAERQRILKDSRVGAFAVISMILMAIGTFAAFFTIAEREMATMAISYTVTAKRMPILNIMALVLIPVISRATAGSCVLALKPLRSSQYAETNGTGETSPANNQSGSDTSKEARKHLNAIVLTTLLIVAVLLIITIALSAGIAKETIMPFVFRLMVPAVSALLGTRIFAELARRNLGGMSGDIAGFSICMGELVGYIALALALSMII